MSAVAQLPLAPSALRRREDLDLDLGRGERSRCSDGGRPTLEQRLEGVWEGLRAAGVADCPVCGARMERSGCRGCGSVLS